MSEGTKTKEFQTRPTCREHTSHTKYRLPSFPVGVLVPGLAAVNSLLAAEEGVAAREDTTALEAWPASPIEDPGT